MALNEKQMKAAAANIDGVLNLKTLLGDDAATEAPAQKQGAKRGRKPKAENANKLAVTFKMESEAAEAVRQIAEWERVTQAAVIHEAIKQYCNHWKPKTQTPPTLPTIK